MEECTRELGDRWYIVIPAYFAVFLPWAFMQKIDFISSSWKSIRTTRRNGLLQFWFTLIPMGLMIAYIVIQIISKDYKEMSAAILAFIFSLQHLLRTWWGLWQLRFFKEWAEKSIQTLESQGVSYDMNLEKEDMEEFKSLRKNKKENMYGFKADLIQINETIVDNQVRGGDTKCELELVLSEGIRKKREALKMIIKKFFFEVQTRFIAFWRRVFVCFRLDVLAYILDPTRWVFNLEPKDFIEIWIRWATAFSSQGLSKWIRNYNVVQDPGKANGHPKEYELRKTYFAREIITSAFLLKDDIPSDNDKIKTYFSGHPLQWDYKEYKGGDGFENFSFYETGKVSHLQMLTNALRTGKGLPFHSNYSTKHGNLKKVSKALKGSGFKDYEYEVNNTARSMPPKFGNDIDEFDFPKLESLTIMLNIGKWALEEVGDKQKRNHESKQPEKNLYELPIKILTRHVGLSKDIRTRSESVTIGNQDTGSQFRLGPLVLPVPLGSTTKTFGENWNITDESSVIDLWRAMRSGDSIEEQNWSTYITNEVQSSSTHSKDSFKDVLSHYESNGSYHENSNIPEDDQNLEIFEYDGIREQNTKLEKLNLAREFEYGKYKSIYLEHSTSFLGIAMESLRSALARYVLANQGSSEFNWTPSVNLQGNISKRIMKFRASHSLSSGIASIRRQENVKCHEYFHRRNIQIRLLWEIQREIIRNLGGMANPESVKAILACLVSFPALVVSAKEGLVSDPEDKNLCILTITPIHGPQKLDIEVHVRMAEADKTSDAVEILAFIRSESTEFQFEWQKWRDAFTGRIIGARQWKEEHDLEYFKECVTYGPLSNELRQIRFDQGRIEQRINIWMGWLPVQPQICEFELELEENHKELSENEMNYRRALLEERLKVISEKQKQKGPIEVLLSIFENQTTMDTMVDNAMQDLENLDLEKISNNRHSVIHVAAANGHEKAYEHLMKKYYDDDYSEENVPDALMLTEDFVKQRREHEKDNGDVEKRIEDHYRKLLAISDYRASVVCSLSKYQRTVGNFKHTVNENEMLCMLRNSLVRTGSSMILWEMIWLYSYCGRKRDAGFTDTNENIIQNQLIWLYDNTKTHLKRIFSGFFDVHDHDNSSSEDRHLSSLVLDISHEHTNEDDISWIKLTLQEQLEEEKKNIHNFMQEKTEFTENGRKGKDIQKIDKQLLLAKYRRKKIARVLGNLFKANINTINGAPFLCVYYHGLAAHYGSLNSITTLKSIISDERFVTEEIADWMIDSVCYNMRSSGDVQTIKALVELAIAILRKYQQKLSNGKTFILRTMEEICRSPNQDKMIRNILEEQMEQIENVLQLVEASKTISDAGSDLTSVKTE